MKPPYRCALVAFLSALLWPSLLSAAALIARVGVGAFPDEVSAARQCATVVARNDPDPARRQIYGEAYGIYHDAALALMPINHRLAADALGKG